GGAEGCRRAGAAGRRRGAHGGAQGRLSAVSGRRQAAFQWQSVGGTASMPDGGDAMRDGGRLPKASLRFADAALLVFAATIYGGIFPVNRLAAEALWPPLGFAFAQSLLAGLVLAGAAIAAGGGFAASAAHLRAYLVM